MNKRFWRGLMAILLGLALIVGTGGAVPVRTAWASESETVQPEANEASTETKFEKDVTYVAGDQSATAKASAGSKIPSLSSLGLKAPEGKKLACWGTTETGGTTYRAGKKFSTDESKIPSKLYAHWKDADEADAEDGEVLPEDESAETPAASGTQGQPGADPVPPPAENPPAPADDTIPPVDGNTPPVEGNTTPVDGNTPPVDGNTLPVEGDTTPVEGDNTNAPAEIAMRYHLGGASVSVSAAPDSQIPFPSAVGLAIPEGEEFYWWSSSADGSADDMYFPGDSITAATPTTLYAMCAPATNLMMVPTNPAFSRVRYHQTGADARYIEVNTSIETARAYDAVGFQSSRSGEQFLYWQTAPAGGTTILPGAPIDTLSPSGTDTIGGFLDLYGVWQATALPALTIAQTADKPYIGRGETVTFTITVANTDATYDAYVRVENVADPRFTVLNAASSTVRWDLRVNHGTRASVTLTARANENVGDGMIFNTATVIREVRVDPAITTSIAAQLDSAAALSDPTATVRTDVLQVVYDGNGGTINGAATFVDNTGYRAAQANRFARNAAAFVCWNTAQDGSGTDYAPGAAIPIEDVFSTTKTFTLYAKWALPVLSVSQTTLNSAIVPGQNIAYTIQIKNSSAVAANNVIVSDALPANLTYVSSSPAAQTLSNGGLTLQWNVNVPAKGVTTLTVNARANTGLAAGTQIANTALVTTIGGLTADGASFPGSTFSATTTNTVSTKKIIYHPQNGAADYEAVGDVNPVALDLSGTFTRAGYQLTGWNTLANGSGTLYAIGQALPAFVGDAFHLYAVWTGSTQLHIAQSADKTSIVPGQDLIFTVTVSNTGSAAAKNITVSEQPDANLTTYADYVVNSARASVGTYDPNTRLWTIPTLGANASATLQLTFKAKAINAANTTLVNTAQITGHSAVDLNVYVTPVDPSFASVNVALNVNAGSLRISNKVAGNHASTTRDFTYRITLLDAAGMTLPGSATYTTSTGTAGSFNLSQPFTFTLRHDQSILLWNLPAGAQFKVEEIDYRGYWPNQATISGSINGDQTAGFVNSRNRNTDIPKTGYGEGGEWLLWLTLPLLGGALWLLLIQKRKLALNRKH